MTSESVATQQDDIAPQHQAANAQAEIPATILRGKPHALPGIVAKDKNKGGRHVKKVSVDVLEYEGKLVFAAIAVARFTHRAIDGISPKSLVVGTPIVIAGEPETSRGP